MSVCAILLSYKRPQNLSRLLETVANTPQISKIILSNNNPDIDIHEYIDADKYPLEIVIQDKPTLYTKRFEIALSQPYEYFFCPDDDIFLSVGQVSTLIDKLLENPRVPHGVTGQVEVMRNNQIHLLSGCYAFKYPEVNILNRAYFFTKAHVTKMFELSKSLGYEHINEARYMDDVLLSFAGEGLPRIHNVGKLLDCETSHTPGIATWKENDFYKTRLKNYLRLTGRWPI